jgi:putative flippase GtrA
MGNISKKLLRFLLAGIFVTVLHLIIAFLLIYNSILNPPAANAIAFMFSTFCSLIINTVWSFSSELNHKVFCRFLITSLAGLCLTIFVSWLSQEAGLHYLIGIFFVVAIVPFITFTLHRLWTYRNQ